MFINNRILCRRRKFLSKSVDKQPYLNEEEYNFFSEMYWDEYQEYLLKEDFEQPIEKQEIVVSNLSRFTLSKACSQVYVLTLVTAWTESSFINSYDVVGARVADASLTSVRSALVTGTNYAKTYSIPQTFNKGNSILVSNIENSKVILTFTTTKSGTAYGSYQHAVFNIT